MKVIVESRKLEIVNDERDGAFPTSHQEKESINCYAFTYREVVVLSVIIAVTNASRKVQTSSISIFPPSEFIWRGPGCGDKANLGSANLKAGSSLREKLRRS